MARKRIFLTENLKKHRIEKKMKETFGESDCAKKTHGPILVQKTGHRRD